jgi:hypothetical protein
MTEPIEELLEWLHTFDELQFSCNHRNVIEKIWQINSKQQLLIQRVSDTLILTPKDAEIFFNEIMNHKANVKYNVSLFNEFKPKNYKMKISEQRAKAMVIVNIIDNCTMELDNTGQERYSMDENQFGKAVDTLVKNINVIQCCMELKDKKITDLLNWVKSDLAQETNVKLGKTATPYRTEKLKFLNKLLAIQNL